MSWMRHEKEEEELLKSLDGHVHAVAVELHDAASAICLRMDTLINLLREKGEQLMSELDDLKAAVANLTTAVSTAAADLSSLAAEVKTLSTQSTIDPAAVEAAAKSIQAQADALNAASTGAVPPAPAPTTTTP